MPMQAIEQSRIAAMAAAEPHPSVDYVFAKLVAEAARDRIRMYADNPAHASQLLAMIVAHLQFAEACGQLFADGSK